MCRPVPRPGEDPLLRLRAAKAPANPLKSVICCTTSGTAGIAAIGTREPGGSPGAEILRKLLLSGRIAHLGPAAEAILFAAARIDHIDTTIAPALAAGTWVVSDRYADSTRAYQGARGQVDPRFLRALERIALGNVRPDLTLILDLPVTDGLARATARRTAGEAPDRFEREDLAFHETLRSAFLSIASGGTGALHRHRCSGPRGRRCASNLRGRIS